ncbi:hypothetical protein JVT61DRAFT_9534 [Boletus reticuloceps]|uniref:Uncharacterized protein n=1 Tax=Boletus reticuloceps TaxID=495285 RepID=A0A8I2YG45_9AGAM|nr:hypothetical protein JVT61DRAFT_9534 [Boletus reticuloceps]
MTKFGGFDLDSEGNEDKKKEKILFKNKKGQLNDNSIVPSAPDSNAEIEASQVPPWYLPRIPSNPGDKVEIEASQIPPWYSLPHIPSTPNNDSTWYSPPYIASAGKRKMKDIVLDSNPEGEEITESNMQVDTDVEHKIQTMVLSTSHQTSVSITMEDTQPLVKKAKIEVGKETWVETHTTTASMDAVNSKKTCTVDTESKSRSDYKNIYLFLLTTDG